MKSKGRVIWRPQPRQIEFMSRPEYEVLYGGAAGGGKSDALVVEALRQVNIPCYRGIIFRKTYPELRDLIDRSQEIYKPVYPEAKYNSTSHTWTFPSGAKIEFGAMQHTKDRTKYQGRQFDFVAFDELTHFTWDEYSYLFSRNRSNGQGTRVYMRASTNPGGVGHGWVKNRFIDPAPPGTPITEESSITKDGKTIEVKRTRVFIPSTIFDNKALMDRNPEYVASLAMLPQAERDALLYGSWDSFSGQVFREWKNDPAHYQDRLWTHVVDDFMPPRHWVCWRGFDWGYAKPFSVGWYVADERGKIYRIKEFYGCTDTPNTGVQMQAAEIAEWIRKIEREDDLLKGREIIGVADPSIFDVSRGESIADIMVKHPNYVTWLPADNARLSGKQQYHYRMAFDEYGDPMFQVFKSCRHFIRTIPSLVYDEKKVEDVDTSQEDHIYDECRYVLMQNPISPRKNVLDPPPRIDPLNQFTSRRNSNWIR